MQDNLLLAMPGTSELMIILLIVLVLFGSSKIPQIMGGFGKGIKNFKKAVNDETNPEDDEPKVQLEAKEQAKQLDKGKEV